MFTFALPIILLLLFGEIFHGKIGNTGVDFKKYFIAGIVASGLMSATFVNVGVSIAADRDDGTLTRLAGTPLSPVGYFTGKAILAFVVCLLEVAVLLAVSVLLLGLHLPSSPGRWLTLAGFWFSAQRHARSVDHNTSAMGAMGKDRLVTAEGDTMWLEPELATLTKARFSEPAWIYERKFDGERCLTYRTGGRVALMTRNRLDVTATYPELRDALSAQSSSDYVVDGEIVAFDGEQTSFGLLQQRLGVRDPGPDLLRRVPVVYYLFDVLMADGRDLRRLPLRDERKPALRDMLRSRREWGAALGGRLRAGLGGPDRQAGRVALSDEPDQGLAEVQMREQPGVCDRRLHRSARLARRLRRAGSRLLRPVGTTGLRWQGGNRVRRRHAGTPGSATGPVGTGSTAVRSGQAIQAGGALGGTEAGRTGWLLRMDDGGAATARRIARGQGSGQRGTRDRQLAHAGASAEADAARRPGHRSGR